MCRIFTPCKRVWVVCVHVWRGVREKEKERKREREKERKREREKERERGRDLKGKIKEMYLLFSYIFINQGYNNKTV